jgi:hypothetical protein
VDPTRRAVADPSARRAATYQPGAAGLKCQMFRCDPIGSLALFTFTIMGGEPGKSIRVERSRDLVNWESVATVPLPANGQRLTDPAAADEPFLFYRAVSVP